MRRGGSIAGLPHFSPHTASGSTAGTAREWEHRDGVVGRDGAGMQGTGTQGTLLGTVSCFPVAGLSCLQEGWGNGGKRERRY